MKARPRILKSDSWKVAVHREVPFVLKNNGKIVESVFGFLRLLHLRGMSDKTIRAYAYDLLAFHRFLEEQAVAREHFDVIDFLLSQRKHNAAPRTINRRLMVVRSFLNHGERGSGDRVCGQTGPFYKGARNKALLGPLRIKGRKKSLSVKVPGILITPLSSLETRKFLLGLRKYRDIAILYLMIFCGLRSCEVLSLETEDIDLIDDQLRIKGKGQKERLMPLSKAVRKALVHYLDYERPETNHKRCFVVLKGANRGQPMTAEGLRKLFRNQRRKSVKRAHAHLFRHTFATNLIREHVSLPVVQKLMGHSDIEVTMGYIHMSPGDVS
ncbi:MAG: tyrosine-type recombinase/integrase, partial [bacterium]|nr:tyrosine-type recombinase/integrase [bacterium]